jgi:hypothetical protein
MFHLKRMQERIDGKEKPAGLADLDSDVRRRVARRGKQPHLLRQFGPT